MDAIQGAAVITASCFRKADVRQCLQRVDLSPSQTALPTARFLPLREREVRKHLTLSVRPDSDFHNCANRIAFGTTSLSIPTS
jgi:hypothetical protein